MRPEGAIGPPTMGTAGLFAVGLVSPVGLPAAEVVSLGKVIGFDTLVR